MARRTGMHFLQVHELWADHFHTSAWAAKGAERTMQVLEHGASRLAHGKRTRCAAEGYRASTRSFRKGLARDAKSR